MKTLIFRICSFAGITSCIILLGMWIMHDTHMTTKKKSLYDKPGEAANFYIERHAGLDATYIPTDHVLAEINKIQNGKYGSFDKAVVEPWDEMGPDNIGGRTRSLLIDPSSSSILYAASVGGGVWKSADGGSSWISTTDALGNIAFTSLAIAPGGTTATRTIYAGTGEGYFNGDAIRGAGLFKTTNSGASWSNIATGAGLNYYINKIAVNPLDASYIYVATNSGIFRSTNSGASFSSIGFSGSRVQDLELNSISPDTLYVAVYESGVHRCGTAKAVTPVFSSIRSKSSQKRTEIALAKSNPAVLYAVFTNSTHEPAYIERTDDGGTTWIAGSIPVNDDVYLTSYMNKQGWYDNMIGIDPVDHLKVFVGGVDTYKSTNGGSAWSKLSSWRSYTAPKIHADNHEMAFASSTTFYIVNDGGIYKTVDGGASWSAKNSGYNVTQFYYGAMSNDGVVMIGGAQDNGTLKSTGSSSWTEIYGGDGGASLISHTSSTNMFASYVYGDFRYSTNSGSSWTTISPPGSGSSTSYLFIAPAEMSPSNSSTVYIGGTTLYRTTNNGTSWTSVYAVPSGKVSAIALSVTTDTMLIGTNTGELYRSTNTGVSWTTVTPAGTKVYITDAEISFSNANVAFITRSGYAAGGHVFRTATLGSAAPSWTDLSGSLPALPVMSVAVNRTTSDQVLLGTEAGLFKSTNSGTSWSVATSGMAASVSVEDLDILYNGTVLAATHGRGMYRSTTPLPVELTLFAAARTDKQVSLKWTTVSEVNNHGFSIERKESKEWREIGFVYGNGTSAIEHRYSFIDKLAPSVEISYRLRQIDRDGSVEYSPVQTVQAITSTPITATMQPNPLPVGSTGVITTEISTPSQIRISIIDITGREVLSESRNVLHAGQQEFHIPSARMRTGVHFASISSSERSVITKFVVVR